MEVSFYTRRGLSVSLTFHCKYPPSACRVSATAVRPGAAYSPATGSGSNCPDRRMSLRRPLPPEPVDDGPAHHPLEIAAREPRQLLGEHRDALPVRDRHARDVGSPEASVRREGLNDL